MFINQMPKYWKISFCAAVLTVGVTLWVSTLALPNGAEAQVLNSSPPQPKTVQAIPHFADEDYSPQPMNEVPPKPQGLNIYVNDYAQLLSPSDRSTLQEQLQALDEANIAQIAVVILPDTDQDLSDFAPQIMNTWDIQHYKKQDGLLVLVNARRVTQNLSGNRIFIGTGYNLEEKLPDALIGRILDELAIPAFSEGDFSGGITRSTLAISRILAGDEKLIAHYNKPHEDENSLWGVIIMVIFMLLLFFNRRSKNGGIFYGGGFGGGYTGGWSSGGGGFGGGFGGGGDSSGGGGAGR